MLTVQMQITVVPESSKGYTPTLEEVNYLVQTALDSYMGNLPPEDLAYMSKFKVCGDLTVKIT